MGRGRAGAAQGTRTPTHRNGVLSHYRVYFQPVFFCIVRNDGQKKRGTGREEKEGEEEKEEEEVEEEGEGRTEGIRDEGGGGRKEGGEKRVEIEIEIERQIDVYGKIYR